MNTPSIESKPKCGWFWPFRHRWTVWTTVMTSIGNHPSAQNVDPHAKVWMDRRDCLKCGVTQLRTPVPR